MSFLEKQEYEKAASYLDRALEIDNEDAWSLLSRGLIYITDKQEEKGLEYIKKSHDIDPTVLDAMPQLKELLE